MAVRVIVADDFRISRTFFEMLIKDDANYVLLASFSEARDAAAYCMDHDVDLVILDILMRSGPDGLAAAEQIKRARPDVKIILATSTTESVWEEMARRIGVESFWYKEYSEAPLLEVMNRTMAGESVYPEEPLDVDFGKAKRVDLTPRDLDVLRELMRGLSNEEIATRLDISINTVRTHVQNMLAKTGFKNRLSLVVNAARLGIVAAEHPKAGAEDQP